MYDEETGMVGQKKTVVAQVPVEGGGHAIGIAQQVQVGGQVVLQTYRLYLFVASSTDCAYYRVLQVTLHAVIETCSI